MRTALRRRLLRLLVDDRLNMNQELVLAAQKANYIQLTNMANRLSKIY